MNASVCNSKNWINTIEMDQLRSITPVSMGPRHNPVNHGEVLQLFRDKAQNYGIEIGTERGLLSPDSKRYMYVADIRYDSLNMDFAFTIGYLNFNDRSRAFASIAGQHVFVCSNLCVTGIVTDSRTRHSTNVDSRLDVKIDTAFNSFNNMFRVQLNNIDAMKSTKLTDELLGKFILESTRRDIVGATNIRRVIDEVDKPTLNNKDDSSMWRLHNAFTWMVKENVKNPLLQSDMQKRGNDLLVSLSK